MYKSETCQERNNNEKLKDKDLDAKQLKHFCQSRTKTKEGLTRERKQTHTHSIFIVIIVSSRRNTTTQRRMNEHELGIEGENEND